jgi:hypothetical protein
MPFTSAGRTEQQARGDALDRAGDEEPVETSGEREDHLGTDEPQQRGDHHGPAADQVGEASRQQQRHQHADRVDRVDLGHGER